MYIYHGRFDTLVPFLTAARLSSSFKVPFQQSLAVNFCLSTGTPTCQDTDGKYKDASCRYLP